EVKLHLGIPDVPSTGRRRAGGRRRRRARDVGADICGTILTFEQKPVGDVSPIERTPCKIRQRTGLRFLSWWNRRVVGAQQQLSLSASVLGQQSRPRRVKVTDRAAGVVVANHPGVRLSVLR